MARPPPPSGSALDRRPPRRRSADRFSFFFGPEARVLEQRHGLVFGARLAVVDAPRGGDLRRCLASLGEDGMILQQSAMSLLHPERLVFPYEQAMALALAVVPHPTSALLLGLGGGAMVRFLAAHFPHCTPTIVEQEPIVVEFARRHFYITEPVQLAEAASFVATARGRFDAILVDIYGGAGFSAPPLDFWDRCAALLSPQGTIAINWAEARDKPLYQPHAERAGRLAARSFYLAPNGFKDNVVQLCTRDPALSEPRLRDRAADLARRLRRRSILNRCAVLDGFPSA